MKEKEKEVEDEEEVEKDGKGVRKGRGRRTKKSGRKWINKGRRGKKRIMGEGKTYKGR